MIYPKQEPMGGGGGGGKAYFKYILNNTIYLCEKQIHANHY